mmetsp:Transcript_6532/g.10221  ORF Transcript_6532/g.10221 Transcript_6532/m.10221 type:complete len:210 (+) Transcript_6532:1869-2498(+)
MPFSKRKRLPGKPRRRPRIPSKWPRQRRTFCCPPMPMLISLSLPDFSLVPMLSCVVLTMLTTTTTSLLERLSAFMMLKTMRLVLMTTTTLTLEVMMQVMEDSTLLMMTKQMNLNLMMSTTTLKTLMKFVRLRRLISTTLRSPRRLMCVASRRIYGRNLRKRLPGSSPKNFLRRLTKRRRKKMMTTICTKTLVQRLVNLSMCLSRKLVRN